LDAPSSSKSLVVGRTIEISNLFLSLDNEKSITVLAGEAGIGKTTLLNEFYNQLWLYKKDSHFVGYFDKNKELRSAGLIYPFITVLESLLNWISKTRVATDKVKETMSRMEKAFVKFIKEKGTEIGSALIQDIAEKIGLKETLKISKEFLKTFKEQRSATMLADTYVTENKTEVISSYIDIFNILKTEFEEHVFVLIFDQFENVGIASIDFLIDFVKNLPNMFHIVVSFRSEEEEISDDTVAKKVYEYTTRSLEELGAREIIIKGLSAEEIGVWIKTTKGIDLPLIPDLKRIREFTDGIPIILTEWINQSDSLNYDELEEFKKSSSTNKFLCKYILEHKRVLNNDTVTIKNLNRLVILLEPLNIIDLAKFLNLNFDDLQIFIDKLLEIGIFEKRDTSFWFRHDLVRKCLENSLTEEYRENLHRSAAKFFLDLFNEGEKLGNVKNAVFIGCAYHLHQAGESMKEKCIQFNKDLAKRASSIGDLDLAERCYKRIIDDSEEVKDTLDAYLELAHDIYIVWGRYDDAYAVYQELLKYSPSNQSAQILSYMAQIHYIKREYEIAMECYDKSFSLAEATANQTLLGEILHDKAIIKYDMKMFDESLNYFNDCKEIFKRIENKIGEISCSSHIANIYRIQKEYDKSIELLQECLQEAKKFSNPSIMSEILYYMANVYYDKQQYEESIKLLTERLSIEKNLGNQHGTAITLFSMGKSLKKKYEYKESLSYLLQAHSILKRIGHNDAELVESEILFVQAKVNQLS
jgi:tetratricopeptide (TPR) repeat protein